MLTFYRSVSLTSRTRNASNLTSSEPSINDIGNCSIRRGTSTCAMIYLPPLRRFLVPALLFITFVIFYRGLPITKNLPTLVIHSASVSQQGVRVPIKTLKVSVPIFNASSNHLSPPNYYFYDHKDIRLSFDSNASTLAQPALDTNLAPLFHCPSKPNQYTGHIRLPNIVYNISMVSTGSTKLDPRTFWNPTIIALPYWSANQYLVVQRILTPGNHQENVMCEANFCRVGSSEDATKGENSCSSEDLRLLGPAGGMRCAHTPITLNVPPTPAEYCAGKYATYMDIPGFHDPRIFWSGKGEPLMMVNTQSVGPCPSTARDRTDVTKRSRYACFGLWIIDLRSLHPPLQSLLSSSPTRLSLGPLKSYPFLTELTRNPPETRSPIEKNWMLFFTTNGESYIHYDLPSIASRPHNSTNNTRHRRGRTFAKLLGNGLTTRNLTSSLEQSCIHELTEQEEPDKAKRGGRWHQATNALRLILCNRADPKCRPKPQNTVFVGLVHRKFQNFLKLPLRYERLFMVWASTPPFHMLALSRYPILFHNETALGWSYSQIWDDDWENRRIVEEKRRRKMRRSRLGGR